MKQPKTREMRMKSSAQWRLARIIEELGAHTEDIHATRCVRSLRDTARRLDRGRISADRAIVIASLGRLTLGFVELQNRAKAEGIEI